MVAMVLLYLQFYSTYWALGGGGRGNGAVVLVDTCEGGVGLDECDGDADADLVSLLLREKMSLNAVALRVVGRTGVSSMARE